MPSSSVTASPQTFATAASLRAFSRSAFRAWPSARSAYAACSKRAYAADMYATHDRLVELPCEQRAAQILVGREEVFDEKQFGERRRDLREGDALLERVVRLRVRGQPPIGSMPELVRENDEIAQLPGPVEEDEARHARAGPDAEGHARLPAPRLGVDPVLGEEPLGLRAERGRHAPEHVHDQPAGLVPGQQPLFDGRGLQVDGVQPLEAEQRRLPAVPPMCDLDVRLGRGEQRLDHAGVDLVLEVRLAPWGRRGHAGGRRQADRRRASRSSGRARAERVRRAQSSSPARAAARRGRDGRAGPTRAPRAATPARPSRRRSGPRASRACGRGGSATL